jgi:8-amino-7-oxononanoate synthase
LAEHEHQSGEVDMSDLFAKCQDFNRMKDIAKKINRCVPPEERWGIDDDFIDSNFISLIESFNKESPIDNGGPIISKNGQSWIQFCCNNYFGLSSHPEINQVACDYIQKYGTGLPMGSRLLGGTTELHFELERQIAEYKRTEDALTFSIGANAMIGAVSALATPSDVIILDEYAHQSLFCGAIISKAKIKRFKHNNLDHLESLLKRCAPGQGKFIVVDGVFSMDGDMAPLKEICDLRDKYNAKLLVDDAHGNGTLGERGAGAAEVLGVEERIDVHAGTFSKAFGQQGGFIAASHQVINHLRHMANTTIFTKSQPAFLVATIKKALEIVINANSLRQKLKYNAEYLQTRLRNLGFNLGTTMTPITPIIFPGLQAVLLSKALRDNYGIWAQPVTFPAVPIRKSIIRIIPTAMHTTEQFDYFCSSLVDAYRQKDRLVSPEASLAATG